MGDKCRVCGGELKTRSDDQDEGAIDKRHNIYYDGKTGTVAAINYFKNLSAGAGASRGSSNWTENRESKRSPPIFWASLHEMDHGSWIRNHFESYGKSHGFLFTPGEEIRARISRLRAQMSREGIEALLVAQKMDLFYLSGTSQDGSPLPAF
jgi:hypothetical protein